MSNFNKQEFDISVEGETAVILSHFDSEYILNVINDNFNRRLNNDIVIPNIVSALEMNFQTFMTQYPDSVNETLKKRNDIYEQVIDIICTKNNLTINKELEMNSYTVALYLYDIFISNFRNYLITLYTNIILKEKNMLFDSLGLKSHKRNKDSSTLFGKKSYKNTKVAVINANLDIVLNYLFSFSLSFYDILQNINYQSSIIEYLMNTTSPNGDIFRELYIRPFLINESTRIDLLNSIRLNIHTISINTENYNIF